MAPRCSRIRPPRRLQLHMLPLVLDWPSNTTSPVPNHHEPSQPVDTLLPLLSLSLSSIHHNPPIELAVPAYIHRFPSYRFLRRKAKQLCVRVSLSAFVKRLY